MIQYFNKINCRYMTILYPYKPLYTNDDVLALYNGQDTILRKHYISSYPLNDIIIDSQNPRRDMFYIDGFLFIRGFKDNKFSADVFKESLFPYIMRGYTYMFMIEYKFGMNIPDDEWYKVQTYMRNNTNSIFNISMNGIYL